MGGDRHVLVRRLEAHEVELHRDLRLHALGTLPSPSAKRSPRPRLALRPTGRT